MDEGEHDRTPGDSGGGHDPEPGDRRSDMAGGVLLGLLLGFLVFPFVVTVLLASYDEAGDLVLGLILAMPGLIGLLLLVSPRTRRSGAGMLLGLAIGLVVGSASCVGYFGVAVSPYNG